MFFLHNFKKLIKSNSILTVIAHTLIEKFHFLYSEKEYFLASYLKKPFIIDVGAHNGESVYNFLKFNPHSKIVSIEPNPKNYEIIKSTYSKDKRVKVLNYLISLKKKKQFIYTPLLFNKELSQMSSVSLSLLKQRLNFFFSINLKKFSFKKRIIRTITIDNLNLRPSIIKIDTEGYEYEVLSSARKTINLNKPIIIIEYNHHNFIKILKLMKKFKYSAYQYDNKFKILNSKSIALLKKNKNATNVVYLPDKNKKFEKLKKLIV